MLDRDKVSHPMEVLRSVIFSIEFRVFRSRVTMEAHTVKKNFGGSRISFHLMKLYFRRYI